MMTRLNCSLDENICLHNICKLTLVRKKVNLIDFACYFEKKQDDLMFRLQLHRIGSGARKIIDATEDFCQMISKEGRGSVLTRFIPSVEGHGNILSKCPLIGNVTLMRYPMDFSFVPFVLTPGNYRLIATFRSKNSTKKQPLINGDLYFSVRKMFRKK
ncbi:uncharacterized protein LOC119658266 [Hermetia illucens]|nr:uncharacterized protein LOC119658266 [Hermetia illucens]